MRAAHACSARQSDDRTIPIPYHHDYLSNRTIKENASLWTPTINMVNDFHSIVVIIISSSSKMLWHWMHFRNGFAASPCVRRVVSNCFDDKRRHGEKDASSWRMACRLLWKICWQPFVLLRTSGLRMLNSFDGNNQNMSDRSVSTPRLCPENANCRCVIARIG